jgi:hypothetical protein
MLQNFRTCSWGVPLAITSACSISATQLLALYFLHRRQRFSTTSAESAELYRNRNIADIGRVFVFVTRPQAIPHSERPE